MREARGERRAMGDNPYNLTRREREVLALLAAGKTNRLIARELHVREGTVKSHLSSVYVKLGVSNRTEAAVVGVRIDPPLAS